MLDCTLHLDQAKRSPRVNALKTAEGKKFICIEMPCDDAGKVYCMVDTKEAALRYFGAIIEGLEKC